MTEGKPVAGLFDLELPVGHHVGKVPRTFKQTRMLAEQLETLERKLGKAVAREEFEEAAKFRDEIKETRDKLTDEAAT